MFRAPTRLRQLSLIGALVMGVVVAAVPNRLEWLNDEPFEQTATRLFEYEKGTGRGRLIQYRNTVRMSADHALLGVGPGNWSIAYPPYASRPSDPNYTRLAIQPVTRLPSSDWLGLIAERGAPGAVAFLFALLLLGRSAWRTLRTTDLDDDRLRAGALLTTLLAIGVLGLFDAVLLRPTPLFLGFLVLGALAPQARSSISFRVNLAARRGALSAVLLLAVALGVHSACMIRASRLGLRKSEPHAMQRAMRLAPGDYQLRVTMAVYWFRRGDCGQATRYAHESRRLYPRHPVSELVIRSCAGGAGGAREVDDERQDRPESSATTSRDLPAAVHAQASHGAR
jgi:hypothetical protein